jgi:hypothetical protein
MALFARYHVALQEGPGLCLHLLLAAEPDPPAQQVTSPQAGRTLTEQDMLAHVAAHPAPGNKARRKRAATASAA